MEYVLKQKCEKGTNAYAIGVSMGANILANYLGIHAKDKLLSGAVCIQSGIKKWEGVEFFRTSLGGTYNRAMGKQQFKYLNKNFDLLAPFFKEEFGMDLAHELETRKKTYIDYHELMTVPYHGYKDGLDYVKKAAPFFRIPMIETPTMFMNSLNDPFIGDRVIDYEVFTHNKNVILSTNKYAGHMGYHEKILSMKQWHGKPSLDFLDGLKIKA